MNSFRSRFGDEDKVALALYWAEGSKNLHYGKVEFTNSDPQMVTVFLEFLRRQSIDELKLRARVQSSRKAIDQKARLFWSNVTGIPLKQFQKSRIQDGPSESSYRGCVVIRYCSRGLLKDMLNAIQNLH